jgi:hypothetical protein
MVELKRWVAKEATTHGQIISEVELSDEAIYDRLQSDVQFRSVATQLVQRYGYMVPQVNPDSAAGKEQELVAKERAKWVAQAQEQDLAAARQRNTRRMQRTDYCDPRSEANCNTEEDFDGEQAPGQQRNDQREQEYPPTRMGPSESNPQNAPRVSGEMERATFNPGDEGTGT